MHDKQMSIRTFLERFDRGDFDKPDFDTQAEAGWYDWFCKDTALCGKTKKLGRYLKQICKPAKPHVAHLLSPKINIDTMYVFFKNNCPMYGNLYDDFRICDMKTGDVIWTITPRSGHKQDNGRAELWGRQNQFQGPILTGTWKDIKNFFLGEKNGK